VALGGYPRTVPDAPTNTGSPTGPAPSGAPRPAPKTRIVKHPWRVAIVLGAVLLMVNLAIVMSANTDTTEKGLKPLPNEIESITPQRGELTGLVDTITVDLRDDLSGVLVVDGVEIPEDQLERVVGLQQVTFRPGPGKEISRFRAGDNTVEVLYWPGRLQDRPAKPFDFGWTFRAGA
jgi:hypothetical protein